MNTDLEIYATITPYSYYTTLPTRLSFSDLSLDYSSISSVWRNYAYLGKDSMKTDGEQMILPPANRTLSKRNIMLYKLSYYFNIHLQNRRHII